MVDNFSVFCNQSQKRKKFYEQKEYQLATSVVADDGETSLDSLLEDLLDKKQVVPSAKKSSKKTGGTIKEATKSKCLIVDED